MKMFALRFRFTSKICAHGVTWPKTHDVSISITKILFWAIEVELHDGRFAVSRWKQK